MNGIINLDSEKAKEFGFTSDRFEDISYLWEDNNIIWISFIMSKEQGKGYLRELFKNIKQKGYKIYVPTPFPLMERICLKYGFKKVLLKDKAFGSIEVMIEKKE